jgi:Zn-dependent M28 family amino/carboxypeptidase
LRHTAVFAALDAEELGLQGARAFLDRPIVPASRIAIDVNLDMVSRSDRNQIYAAGTYHSPWLVPILEDVRRRAAVTLLFGHDRPGSGTLDDWTMQSDHGVFHQAGVPFVYFGVEDHPDYHKPTDTADKIDPAFYRNVVEMLLDAVLALDVKLDS